MKYFKDLEIDFNNCCVLLDVDGTITFDSKKDCSDCLQKISDIKNKQNEIYLCSNGKDKNRIIKMSRELKVRYISSKHKKPSKRILDNIELEQKNNELIVIGDKILTDGLLARRLKARFVKVKRLSSKDDSFKIKIINFIDDVLSNFRILRPNHWIKNLLIFAPLFFAKDFFNIPSLLSEICLFIAFCALASSVYIFNDLRDKNEDKFHPLKKVRPLASGEISKTNAIILMVIMLSIASVISFLFSFPPFTMAILASYVLLNLFYSLWLKQLPIVDIFSVASMYVMRIYAGGSLLNIHLSAWIILCTFFLALFLVVAKRRSEFNALVNKNKTRKVMQLYNNAFLDHMLTISTTFCLISYSFYLVSFDDNAILFAFFFVLFGIMRYLYLVYGQDLGQSPESIVIKDPWMIVSVIGWVLYNTYFLYNL